MGSSPTGRSKSIMREGRVLGIWTEVEKDYLREHVKESVIEVHRGFCGKFGEHKRSYSAVLHQLMTLGLRPPERKVHRRFDDQEREFIKNNPTMPIATLSERLDRCEVSVRTERRKLGILSLTKLGHRPKTGNKALKTKGEIPQTTDHLKRKSLIAEPSPKEAELPKVHESLQAPILTKPEEGLTYQLSVWLASYKLVVMEEGCITTGRRYCIVCKNDLYAIFREPL